MVSTTQALLGLGAGLAVGEATGVVDVFPGIGPSGGGGPTSPTELPPGLAAILSGSGGGPGLPPGFFDALPDQAGPTFDLNLGGGRLGRIPEQVGRAGQVQVPTAASIAEQVTRDLETQTRRVTDSVDVPTAPGPDDIFDVTDRAPDIPSAREVGRDVGEVPVDFTAGLAENLFEPGPFSQAAEDAGFNPSINVPSLPGDRPPLSVPPGGEGGIIDAAIAQNTGELPAGDVLAPLGGQVGSGITRAVEQAEADRDADRATDRDEPDPNQSPRESDPSAEVREREQERLAEAGQAGAPSGITVL